jgi:hypothetical protein
MVRSCRGNLTIERGRPFRIVAYSVYLSAVFAWMSSLTLDLPASTFFTREYRPSTRSERSAGLGHDSELWLTEHKRIPTEIVRYGHGCKEVQILGGAADLDIVSLH